MGGCASRPKDLDINEPAPVPAPVVEKAESAPVAQENNGGEETKKTEEPLVDLSEPTEETAESSGSNAAEEVAPVAEAKTDKVEVEAEVVAESKPEVQPTVEVAPPAEPETIPEPVKEEAKPVEAQSSEVKSDAPLVTV